MMYVGGFIHEAASPSVPVGSVFVAIVCWASAQGLLWPRGHTLWGQHIFHPVLWSDSRKKDFFGYVCVL